MKLNDSDCRQIFNDSDLVRIVLGFKGQPSTIEKVSKKLKLNEHVVYRKVRILKSLGLIFKVRVRGEERKLYITSTIKGFYIKMDDDDKLVAETYE